MPKLNKLYRKNDECFDKDACNIGNNQSQLLNSDGPFWVRTRCDVKM